MGEENQSQQAGSRAELEASEPQKGSIPKWLRLRSPVAAALVLLGGVVLLLLVWLLAAELAIVILGTAIAAALSPVESWFARRLPRVVGIIVIYGLVLLFVVGLIWFIFPMVAEQVQEIAAQVPDWLEEIQNIYLSWDQGSEISIVELISNQAANLSASLVSLPVGLASSVFQVVLILFISIYLLLEAPDIHEFFLSLFPEAKKERVDEVTREMIEAMGGFVRGVAIVSLIVGTLTYFGLLIIGVNYPLVLALVAGVLEVIPFLGPILAGIPILLVAFLDSPITALITLIFWVIVQQTESYILTPNIMHSQTKISPLLVLLAIMLGGAVGGVLWILAAIPLAAAFHVLVRRVLAPWLRQLLAAA